MRIRQIKPAFWSDKVVGRLPPRTRLAFIGLWMLADDTGWIDGFDVEQAAAQLYPYEPAARRERELSEDVDRLVAAGRVVRHECGCLHIPRLEQHQRINGKRSERARDAHAQHLQLLGKQSPLTDKQKVLTDKQHPLTYKRDALTDQQPPLIGSGNRLR